MGQRFHGRFGTSPVQSLISQLTSIQVSDSIGILVDNIVRTRLISYAADTNLRLRNNPSMYAK